MNYFLKLLSALIGGKPIFTKKFFTRFSLQSKCNNFNQWEHWIYNRSCWRELGGGIALFCCQKWVGGLGPFGPALKNHHTLLFKNGTMWEPIKTRKIDLIYSNGGGFLTWGQSGVRGECWQWVFAHSSTGSPLILRLLGPRKNRTNENPY